jgi:hypothetical protein
MAKWFGDPQRTSGYLKRVVAELGSGWETHIIGVIEMAAMVVNAIWEIAPKTLAVFTRDHRHRGGAACDTGKKTIKMRATWKKKSTLDKYFMKDEPSMTQLGEKMSKSSINS